MKIRLVRLAHALMLAFAAPTAFAATQLGDYLSVSGFGTLGGVQTNTDQGRFGKDRQPNGANKSAAFDVDSNLGLQATVTATSWLSGTVQALAAKRGTDHVEPDIEWAFVAVKPLAGLQIRGGQMAGPVFAISDSRNVGYANTWLRAPNEVYALNFFNTYTGGDVTYRLPIGPVALVATGVAGKTTSFKTRGLDAVGNQLRGVSLQLEADWATFRVSKFDMKIDIPTIRVFASPYTFRGFGLTVDRDNLLAQAEYVQRRVDRPGPQAVNSNGWYVMGGWHFGNVLPYLIVSGTAPTDAGIPDGSYVSSRQNTTALGVRWDALSFADVKFQIDRIDTHGTKGISFTTPPANLPGPAQFMPVTKSPVLAFSIAVDFTF